MHGAKRGLSERAQDRERHAQGRATGGGRPLIRALAAGAVAAWAIGTVAMPLAAWIWLRRGGRRRVLALVAFAGGLVAQAAWLYEVATGGLSVVLEPDAGLSGWGAWSLGFAGLVAIVSGLAAGLKRGPGGLLDPDRAFEIAIGCFGVGVLLQQIARALA